ncbi:aromatic acid/H+ symport family MFS transporter [Rhodococcus opacus]|nr:aromatic acid/H+ symport family MFS transporter [Rhodococcus opacus]
MLKNRTRRYSSRTVVLTCLAITILDGFDLLVFGATLPTLLETGQWGMTTVEAGFIGSLSLFGMMFGALYVGYLTDRLGRRPTLLTSVALFALFTGLCAVAPSLEIFGALRFLGGLGFGGALPTVIALTMEYVRSERRQLANGVIQSGIALGGVIVSLTAIVIIPMLGWRALYAIGGILSLALLAVAYRNLPESMAFLSAKGRVEEARALAEKYAVPDTAESAVALAARPSRSEQSSLRRLLGLEYGRATLLFLLTTFCALLVAFGMQTWIPQILRSSGYELGSALAFLLMFNVGSIAGTLFLNYSAGRWGPRRTIVTGFLVGAVSIIVLTMHPPQTAVFVIMVVIGFCTGSQPAVYGFIGVYYPVMMRGTALGSAAGVGRLGGITGPLLVGFVMSSSFGSTGVFITFAIVGVIAAVFIGSIPRAPRPSVKQPIASDHADLEQALGTSSTGKGES